MSHEPSAKRQRLDDSSSAARPASSAHTLSPERIADLQAKIWSMKPEQVQAMAAQFVSLDASCQFSQWVDDLHARAQAKERAQTLNFAKYAQKADYIFNQKYDHLSGSKQYAASGDAESAVEHLLDDIVARTKEHSNYATKKSAVETMRSIFMIMLDAGGVIGKEVRNDCCEWDAKFLQVMGTFTEEELTRLATEDDGAWVDKFRALVENANDCCILERLQESLDDLEVYQAGDGDDDEEEDEDEDED